MHLNKKAANFWWLRMKLLRSRLNSALGADSNQRVVQTTCVTGKLVMQKNLTLMSSNFFYFFKKDHLEKEGFFIFGTETQHKWVKMWWLPWELDLVMNYLKSSARAFGACRDWTRCLVQTGTMSDAYCWITWPCVSFVLIFSLSKEWVTFFFK